MQCPRCHRVLADDYEFCPYDGASRAEALLRPHQPAALRHSDLQAALQQSEQLTRGILASVPAGVVHVRADGAILHANAEALRVLGLGFDELTQRFTRDFEPETIFEDGSPCTAADYPVTKALVTGEPQPAVTIGVKRRDGGVSWCVFRAAPVKDADGVTTGAVVSFHDVSQQIETANTLRRSEAKFKAIVTSAPNIICTADETGRITFMNQVVDNLDRVVDTSTIVGQSVFNWINKRDHARMREAISRVVENAETVELEIAGLDSVDPNYYVTRIGPVLEGGKVASIAMVVSVITERKRAEDERVRLLAQLHEAQRLESLGRLAGGVAHDFNNLLTVIQGSVDLLRARVGNTQERIADIGEAASRAASLTKQLLAFGRGQPMNPRVIDIRFVVDEIAPMLRRLVGEHIEIVIDHAPDLGCVRADRAEFERVIVNLVMNARDAMSEGGRCTIRTRNLAVNAAGATFEPEDRKGSDEAFFRVAMEVADTGSGMDRQTLDHAFEPFFTTKEVGRGSGLGLATVHGIVSQSGGAIEVESAPGIGTTFRILLPLIEDRPEKKTIPPRTGVVRARETILIVEDEPRVRAVTKSLLEDEGYTVLEADGPEQALAMSDDTLRKVKVLFTDVVMPGINGPAMAGRLRIRAPHLKVLLMSGHVREALGELPDGFAFLSKPFDKRAMCDAIRALIDG
ncbi:MAG: PAS domain-containing protein [Polyangiaceae bacterium]|nr:PAS domain-containing protein [Polyangiaceae bacterium]